MKLIKQCILIFICMIFMVVVLPHAFADDYMLTGFEYEGHTYAIYNLNYTWNQAKEFCENLGGHLVSINSAEENEVLYKVLSQEEVYIDRVWIDGYCSDGVWYWNGGDKFDYTNFYTEPSGESYEQHLIFNKNNFKDKWGFASDEESMALICEWDFKLPAKLTEYELKGSAKYYPNDDIYQLTGLRTWDFGGVWLNEHVDSDFVMSFDYKTGGGVNMDFGGADGFVFVFYADSNYIPEFGEELGFGGCGGYGIEFDSFTNENDSENPHIALIGNDNSNHLVSVDSDTVEDNRWHHADISVSATDISVEVDGEVVLTWSGELAINNFNLGFSATTGSGMNNHYIKNIDLKRGYKKYSRSTSVGAPVINNGTAKYNENTYDIFEQTISVEKDSKTKIDVAAYVNPNGCEDVHIYLTQDVAHEVELTNSQQNTIIPAEVFSPGKDIYILAVDNKTGKSTSLVTKLKVSDRSDGDLFPESNVDGLNFKLFKETGFTIPDDIAIFGGTEIKWDFGFLPLSVEYDKEDSNKVNIVFGTNIETFDGEESKYFKDFDFDEYKEDIKKSIEGGKSLKKLKKDFMLSDEYKMNLFGGKVIGGGSGSKSFESNILGYAEMKVIDGELKFVEGQICLELEVSLTYEGQLFIWVVPVYYEIGGGLGAEFEGKMINIDPESFEPKFEAYVGANVSAKIGAGIGVAKVATVGAKGEGSLNVKTAMHKEYLKAWAEGEADFNVKIFGKEVAKKPFAKGEFLIYETGNPNGLISDDAVSLTSANKDLLYSGIDINAVYPNESRDYLKNPSEWLGDKQTVSLLNEETENSTITTLAQNIYTEAAPLIDNVDGRLVLVTLWDNDKRNDINKTMLVYSVYDEWYNTWSEPVAVYDDGTADYYPSFSDGVLVWHNCRTELNDNMTLGEIAAQGEIFAARWNGDGFDEPVRLTNNDTLDTIPVVSRNYNDEISVVWVNNSDNDILGMTGKNSVVSKKFDPEIWEWCEQTTVKADVGNIINFDVSYINEKLYIAYEIDTDSNADTVNDREIYLICDDVVTRVTNNDVIDSNPKFGYDKLFYYSQGNISYVSVEDMSKGEIFAEPKYGLTDDFNIDDSYYGEIAVIWTNTISDEYILYASFFENGIWTDAIEVTKSQNMIKYPSLEIDSWYDLYVVYNGVVPYDNAEQNNLYAVDVTKTYDIGITDAYIDTETMTVYVSVTNSGEYNYNGISMYCTDNIAFYEDFYFEDVMLLAGETKTFEFKYKRDDEQFYDSSSSIEIVLSDGYGDNNTFEIAADVCDLAVKEIEFFETLPSSTVLVTIANEGLCDAKNVTVNICDNENDGNIIASKTIDLIKSGKSLCVDVKYDAVAYENVMWYVQVQTDTKESHSSNNAGYFVNECISDAGSLSMNILNFNLSQNRLAVNAFFKNNTSQKASNQALFVLYSKEGALKAVKKQNFDVDEYSDTAVDAWFDNYEYQQNDYVKIIVVDDIQNMKPVIKCTSSEVIY